MNNKEKLIYMILDECVKCCATELPDGSPSVRREDVLSKSREENVVMTRCVFVDQMVSAGYSITTVARILGRTVHSIRHMIRLDTEYSHTSRAYRIAKSEAVLACKDIEPGGL